MSKEYRITKELHVEDKKIKVQNVVLFLSDFNTSKVVNKELTLGQNTPGVYCYFDSSKIYIGESQHPFYRLLEHRKPDDKFKLTEKQKILVYHSDQFHKSAIKHIETELIQLADAYKKDVRAEWKELVNVQKKTIDRLNEGNYFLKDQYKGIADEIWDHWQELHLVDESSEKIRDTPRYRYSPHKNLNSDQVEILEEIEQKWKKEKLIVVEGAPGTGKSLLAFNLFKKMMNTENICLTSGTKATVMDFKRAFKGDLKNENSKILWKYKVVERKIGNFNLVIVDEGHRLLRKSNRGQRDKYKHIKEGGNELEMLLDNYDHVIIFYDYNQVVHDGDFYADEVFGRIRPKPLRLKVRIQERLSSNSSLYLRRLFAFFDGETMGSSFNDYCPLTFFNSFAELYSQLEKLKNNPKSGFPIALLSGYTREWKSKTIKEECDFDDLMPGLKWNSEKNKHSWLLSNGARSLSEVAYYNTVQGLDMAYAGVIIGRDLFWDAVKNCISVNKEYVMNQNELPDQKLPEKEFNLRLLRFVTNRYKILLTRATSGTLVFIEDKLLDKHLRRALGVF